MIEKDAPSAISNYRSVLGDQPDLNNVRRFVARVHVLNKEPEQAKDNLLRVIEADSNDKNSALNTYKNALENVPDSLALVVDFATFYVDSGEIDSAVSQYSAFLKQHPENEVAANNLAMLLVNHKEDQQSLDFATELVQRFRNSPVPIVCG